MQLKFSGYTPLIDTNQWWKVEKIQGPSRQIFGGKVSLILDKLRGIYLTKPFCWFSNVNVFRNITYACWKLSSQFSIDIVLSYSLSDKANTRQIEDITFTYWLRTACVKIHKTTGLADQNLLNISFNQFSAFFFYFWCIKHLNQNNYL